MAKKVIGIILIVFGGIFLAMALLYGLVFGGLGTAFHMISQNGQDFLNDPTTTTCVVEVVSVGDSSTTIEYTVDNSVSVGGNSTSTIVEYTVDGIVYQVELTMEHYQYPVGTQVTVYYNESDPTECQIPELQEATFGTLGSVFSGVAIACTIVLVVFGAAFLIIGIVLVKSYKKQTANTKTNPVPNESTQTTGMDKIEQE